MDQFYRTKEKGKLEGATIVAQRATGNRCFGPEGYGEVVQRQIRKRGGEGGTGIIQKCMIILFRINVGAAIIGQGLTRHLGLAEQARP